MMTVTIITEGGKGIGLGHLTRCTSIYQAFLEKGIKPLFIVNDSTEAKKFLRENEVSFKIGGKVENGYCDALIIDSYLKPKDFYYKISKKAGLLISIDDFNRLDYPSGMVINGSVYGAGVKYNRKKSSKYLLGIRYVPLRKDFWKSKAKKINKKIRNVLLTFGGFNNDFSQNLAKLLLKKHDYNLNVILGNKDKFIKDKRIALYCCISARKMRELILSADVCICAGGQTIYEIARCQTPSVGVCFAQNQLPNLLGARRAGFLKFCGWHNDKNIFSNIEKSLRSLDYGERMNLSLAGRNLVNGKGTEMITEEIIKESARRKN